jgi:uncharacterized protein YjbJ (UPF0337 family)
MTESNVEKDRIEGQAGEPETATIDAVEERVQAEMKEIEGRAKERAGQGMQNEELEREGRRQKEEARQEIEHDKRD